MTLGVLDKIADPEQQTYLGVWDDVQTRAARRFEEDLTAAFQKKYTLHQMLNPVDLLRQIDLTSNQTLPAAEGRGFILELVDDDYQNYVQSNLQLFNIQSVSIYLKSATAADTALKFFDLVTGTLLYSTVIPGGSSGWTSININQRLLAYRIAVTYDATAIESVYQNIDDLRLDSDCYYCNYLRVKGIRTNSVPGSSLTDDDIAQTNDNIYGLTAQFFVECSYYRLVCNNKARFLNTWLYLLGVETMVERMYSPRKNIFTTIESKKGHRLKDHYQKEYEKALKLIVNGTSINDSDICLDCNDPYQIREAIP